MKVWWRFTAIGTLAAALIVALGSNPSMAQPRAHVYLLRGLMNIFSLGMDTLAQELNARGVYATVDNHAEWQSLADQAAARYKAGTEGPIILIGHSLGADAVMEMADYLGAKGVPVALVVPFDGTQSMSASANVARVLNLTQRDYAYMRRGPGFRGTLVNVDVSSDHSIDHLNIDKSPRLHARVISEVLGIVGGAHRMGPATGTQAREPGSSRAEARVKVGPVGEEGTKSEMSKPEMVPTAPPATVAPSNPAPAKTGDGTMNTQAIKPMADSGAPTAAVPVIAARERTAAKPAAVVSQP